MRRLTRILSCLCAACLFVSAPAWTQAPAPDKAAKKDKKEKKAGEAGGAGQVEITWDNGQVLRGQQIIKRLYRLKKSNQWAADRLPLLCQKVLDTGHEPFFKYAKFYQALVAGHDGKNDEALKLLKESVSLGYKNATEIEESAEFAGLHSSPDFKALLEGLQKELRERQIRNYKNGLVHGLEAGLAEPPAAWGEGLQTIDGKPFWRDGQPMIVVVSKLEDDRLVKFAPLLKTTPLPAPLGIVLFDYFEWPAKRVHRFVESLNLGGVPVATVSRAQYRQLRESFYRHFDNAQKGKERSEDEEDEVFRELLPFTTFFDAAHRPLHSLAGVQDRWELELALPILAAALPKMAPPPVEKPVEPPPAPPPPIEEAKPAVPAAPEASSAPVPPPAEAPKPEAPPAPVDPKPEPKPEPTPDPPKPEEAPKPADSPKPEEPKPAPAPDKPAEPQR